MAVIAEHTAKYPHPQSAVEFAGARPLETIRVINIATGDDDGSKWLIAEVPDQAVLKSITLEGAAITGGTSYSVGLHDADGNSILPNAFLNAADFSSTAGLPTGPLGSPIRQCMPVVTPANANKKVFELAGHVNKALPAAGEVSRKSKYRIVLTGNTAGTGAGTLVARVEYLMAV